MNSCRLRHSERLAAAANPFVVQWFKPDGQEQQLVQSVPSKLTFQLTINRSTPSSSLVGAIKNIAIST
jgi:hypothetical protein